MHKRVISTSDGCDKSHGTVNNLMTVIKVAVRSGLACHKEMGTVMESMGIINEIDAMAKQSPST